MPVNVSVAGTSIEVEIKNFENSPSDRRSEGRRQDYLNRKEALVLIKDLAAALERLEAKA